MNQLYVYVNSGLSSYSSIVNYYLNSSIVNYYLITMSQNRELLKEHFRKVKEQFRNAFDPSDPKYVAVDNMSFERVFDSDALLKQIKVAKQGTVIEALIEKRMTFLLKDSATLKLMKRRSKEEAEESNDIYDELNKIGMGERRPSLPQTIEDSDVPRDEQSTTKNIKSPRSIKVNITLPKEPGKNNN